jgi:succinate-acetate transporter protein
MLRIAGGYMGLVTAALAFYLSAADVINEVHGRIVLPVGEPRVFSARAVAL